MDVKPLSIFRSNNLFFTNPPNAFSWQIFPTESQVPANQYSPAFSLHVSCLWKENSKQDTTMFLKKTRKKIKTICDKDEKLHVVWGSRKRQLYISTLSKAFESDCRVIAISMSAWCSQTVGNSSWFGALLRTLIESRHYVRSHV